MVWYSLLPVLFHNRPVNIVVGPFSIPSLANRIWGLCQDNQTSGSKSMASRQGTPLSSVAVWFGDTFLHTARGVVGC